MLLDVNVPRKNGFEVLDDIKNDAELSIIPIVLFTTSRTPEDVARGYGKHANAYVAKPSNVDDFRQTVRAIDDFYTRVCVPLPAPV